MTQNRKKKHKDHHLNTEDGAYINGDVSAARDVIGRDYNVTNNIHHHHPPRAQTNQNSPQERVVQKVETAVTKTVIPFLHRLFLPILIAGIMQLVCLPLLFIVPDLWPLLILPGVVLIAIFYIINQRIGHLLRVADFYNKFTVDQRIKLIQSLRHKRWGHRALNLYTAGRLAFSIQVEKLVLN